MEEEGVEDPLLVAGRKYQNLQQYAQKLGAAAESHPAIAFDSDSTPFIGTAEEERTEDPDDALADVRTYAVLTSQAWKEANQYFEAAFSDEVVGAYSEKGGLDYNSDEVEAYRDIVNKYQKLQAELWSLDQAVERVLEEPPSEDLDSMELLERNLIDNDSQHHL